MIEGFGNAFVRLGVHISLFLAYEFGVRYSDTLIHAVSKCLLSRSVERSSLADSAEGCSAIPERSIRQLPGIIILISRTYIYVIHI